VRISSQDKKWNKEHELACVPSHDPDPFMGGDVEYQPDPSLQILYPSLRRSSYNGAKLSSKSRDS
jgi:hypothetical protein